MFEVALTFLAVMALVLVIHPWKSLRLLTKDCANWLKLGSGMGSFDLWRPGINDHVLVCWLWCRNPCFGVVKCRCRNMVTLAS